MAKTPLQKPIDYQAWFNRALDLLSETLSKWEDEEESVKEEKADHIDDLNKFFADWEKVVEPIEVLRQYALLHDGLSDMIEGGRLKESDVPDDYKWLVESLAKVAPKVDRLLPAPKPRVK